MRGSTSNDLKNRKNDILALWRKRCLEEVPAASTVTELTLTDSLPLYLDHLSYALATNRKIDFRSVTEHDDEASRIGRLHGADRAKSGHYGLTAMIFEYHILREVIFEILEDESYIERIQRDIILDSIEQAVNDASVRFTDIHTDIQQKFMDTLSHDLKNPLTAAKMNLQILDAHGGLSEPAMNSLRKVTANLNRLEAMIHNLLDGSRVRAGEQLTLQFSEHDLCAIGKNVLEEMAVVHGDRFSFHSPKPIIGTVSLDGIQRSIENLVENAVKYSTPDSLISLSLNSTKNGVEITVQNQGAPIPESEIPYLFIHRRRSKEAASTSKLGWGLGLTLVKEVVDSHRGTIKVESTEENGTSFILEIPFLEHSKNQS